MDPDFEPNLGPPNADSRVATSLGARFAFVEKEFC